ncbi:hypothetical protein CgunFtcFv8_017418 [Champsocephalus gunnari]|uniref:Ankyrin repeat domain-containing protein SOWAHD n=1 Tax=Champsocephalus gunnari TaxID=52237 RepID=A0AAN8DRW9_CHAGU|nr:hypothetical protein CgunFtcFv8_017418 [Champsocephalus gunnari]
MNEGRSGEAGRGPAVSNTDTHGSRRTRQGSVVERLSRYSMQVMPSAFQRRSRQLEVTNSCEPGAHQREDPERSSLTPAMRKKYLKEFAFEQPVAQRAEQRAFTDLQLEGNYETLLEFISEDPCLLTRRDFISGYSVLHWLAKRGQDDTLLKLLRFAQAAGIPVNVNVQGSGGLTPLHVASQHRHFMVIKLLVGAFSANVDAMDYNGKRAWQYLPGDAPPEMKELLGTWDDEHSCGGCAQNVYKNVNNSAGAMNLTAYDEVDHGETDMHSFDRTKRGGSWGFGSLRKLLPSFSFLGNKS